MSFESDLRELRSSLNAAPSRQMRIRHERRFNPSSSVARMLSDTTAYIHVAALYDLAAAKRSKPVVVVAIDRHADLTNVEQESVITVRGWPSVGRAVVLDINGTIVEPVYPCTTPVFRPMRFK